MCVKLELTGLVVRDVELAIRNNLHPNASDCTHTIITVTIITTSITGTATKA